MNTSYIWDYMGREYADASEKVLAIDDDQQHDTFHEGGRVRRRDTRSDCANSQFFPCYDKALSS